MPLLASFDTPASLRDMPAGSPFYANWSREVSDTINGLSLGDNGGAFYDATETDVRVVGEKALVWMGFPRDVLLPRFRDDKRAAYQFADSDELARDPQSEYFEWKVDKDKKSGKIIRVTFVTEFREYFQTLWDLGPAGEDEVVAIYQRLVSPAVRKPHLIKNGAYDIFNRWNTTQGIVHYIKNINNLGAAVRLCESAVRSGIPHRDNYEAFPALATETTSVDPRVSYDVHMLVRKGLYVTLKDPVGFYIVDWNNAGIARPDGRPAPARWWKIKRGKRGMALRVEYEVPAGEGLVVGDLTLGGRPIEYGGQLAEQITVAIHGTAGRRTRSGR